LCFSSVTNHLLYNFGFTEATAIAADGADNSLSVSDMAEVEIDDKKETILPSLQHQAYSESHTSNTNIGHKKRKRLYGKAPTQSEAARNKSFKFDA
jgi:hypothetical protein